MHNHYLKPYSEVKFMRSDNLLSVICPWLTLDIELEDSNIDNIDNCLKKIIEQDFLDNNVQSFLNFFSSYPLLYIIPNNQVEFDNNSLQIPDKYQLLEEIDLGLTKNNWVDLSVNKDWHIDVKDVLNFSSIGNDKYSPISVLSYLNHFIFSKSDSVDGLHEKLEYLLAKNESAFFEIIKLILRQSYQVTSSCDKSISPAINLREETRDIVADYVNSEKGHQNLILRSFKHLSDEPIENYFLIPATDILMKLLHHSATNCMMSFSCCISMFEAGGLNECDPLANLLRNSSKPNAAEGLEVHFKINEQEEHALVGLEFAKIMKSVNFDEVVAACLAVEVQSELGNKIQRDIMKEIEKYEL